jgi:hypothetical protein
MPSLRQEVQVRVDQPVAIRGCRHLTTLVRLLLLLAVLEDWLLLLLLLLLLRKITLLVCIVTPPLAFRSIAVVMHVVGLKHSSAMLDVGVDVGSAHFQ